MTNPHIARLNRSLAKNGENIKLRRTVGTVNQANIDVDIRAHVSGPGDKSLIGQLTLNEFFCIFSPSEINAAQWPGGQPAGTTLDARIPSKVVGDQAYIRGGWRDVEFATGKYPGGELVRIDMKAVG